MVNSKFSCTWIVSILFFNLVSHGQIVCNDSLAWLSPNNHSCHTYARKSFCRNSSLITNDITPAGHLFKYPELNCCVCGKNWPIWFLPASGLAAKKAWPQPITNHPVRMRIHRLYCKDSYRNMTFCTMRCKSLPNQQSITSIDEIEKGNFNERTCLLTSNIHGLFRIPTDHYLLYFTNRANDDYKFTCENHSAHSLPNMFCRYEPEESPYKKLACPWNTTIKRYVMPNCIDDWNWTNSNGFSCFDLEFLKLRCKGGRFTPMSHFISENNNDHAEQHCCACGKDALSPVTASKIIDGSWNESLRSPLFRVVHLYNCHSFFNTTVLFDLHCLGAANFSLSDFDVFMPLYHCSLDCFFDGTMENFRPVPNFQLVKHRMGSSIDYRLSSNLIHRGHIPCQSIAIENSMNPPIDTALNLKVDPSANNRSISTVNRSIEPCSNRKTGSECNTIADPCAMARPCLNNGTCIHINELNYQCLCIDSNFTGTHCETAVKHCQSKFCFQHGTCIEINETSFKCQCDVGYQGSHCQLAVDYCENVTCQNQGQCRNENFNFTCDCVSEEYSGTLCEIVSSSMVRRQIATRSIACIAIVAISALFGIIILLDVLKYGLNIDATPAERRRLIRRKPLHKIIRPRTVFAHRLLYINPSNLETIIEE